MKTHTNSSSTAALAAVVLCSMAFLSSCNTAVEGSLAPWGKSIHNKVNNNNNNNASMNPKSFGLSRNNNFLLKTRGGSTKAAADAEAETEEEAPVELYLPGLLDAVISTPDMVCRLF